MILGALFACLLGVCEIPSSGWGCSSRTATFHFATTTLTGLAHFALLFDAGLLIEAAAFDLLQDAFLRHLLLRIFAAFRGCHEPQLRVAFRSTLAPPLSPNSVWRAKSETTEPGFGCHVKGLRGNSTWALGRNVPVFWQMRRCDCPVGAISAGKRLQLPAVGCRILAWVGRGRLCRCVMTGESHLCSRVSAQSRSESGKRAAARRAIPGSRCCFCQEIPALAAVLHRSGGSAGKPDGSARGFAGRAFQSRR